MAFSFGKRFNKEKLFNVDTSEFEYYSLEDLYLESLDEAEGDIDSANEKKYTIRGVYINTKGLYDPAPVLALDDRYVNLPAHMTGVCEEMLKDPQTIKAINAGCCGFTIYQYTQKRYDKECYSVRWCDM
jgi:hypothetical protein